MTGIGLSLRSTGELTTMLEQANVALKAAQKDVDTAMTEELDERQRRRRKLRYWKLRCAELYDVLASRAEPLEVDPRQRRF